jgi:hypothetical protein
MIARGVLHGCFAITVVVAMLGGCTTTQWVMVGANDDYIAYADPASISRDGQFAQLSDLIDLKSTRPSPLGTAHASTTAHSLFDCATPRVRTLAFFMFSGAMGSGDIVENAALTDAWLAVAPGTLLDALRTFACR